MLFSKGYVRNWSEKVFEIKINLNAVPWTYTTSCFNLKKIVGTLYEKERVKQKPKTIKNRKKSLKQYDKLCVR